MNFIINCGYVVKNLTIYSFIYHNYIYIVMINKYRHYIARKWYLTTKHDDIQPDTKKN